MNKIYGNKTQLILRGFIALLLIVFTIVNIKLSHREKPLVSKLKLESLQLKFRQYE